MHSLGFPHLQLTNWVSCDQFAKLCKVPPRPAISPAQALVPQNYEVRGKGKTSPCLLSSKAKVFSWCCPWCIVHTQPTFISSLTHGGLSRLLNLSPRRLGSAPQPCREINYGAGLRPETIGEGSRTLGTQALQLKEPAKTRQANRYLAHRITIP